MEAHAGEWRWTAVAALAAVLYSTFVLDWALRGFTGLHLVVSHLQRPGEPHSTLLRASDVLAGALVVALALALRRRLSHVRGVTPVALAHVLFGIGVAVAAVITLPCAPEVVCETAGQRLQEGAHHAATVAAEVSLLGGVAATWWVTRRDGPAWVRRVAAGGVLLAVAEGLLLLTVWDPGSEAVLAHLQRVNILVTSCWLVCLGRLMDYWAVTRNRC